MSAKIVIVSGAAGLIGKSLCEKAVSEGYAVVGLDQKFSPKRGPYSFNGSTHLIEDHCDVGDEQSVASIFAKILEPAFGLINNAAIADPYQPPVHELTLRDWNEKLRVNLTSVFLMTKYFLAKRATSASIINISSTRAEFSEKNAEIYAASKGAMNALTHALAISYAPQVRVNCISPGWIAAEKDPSVRVEDHEFHPVGRVGKPNDVASLAMFLLGGEAGFITGQNFIVDGGVTKKMIYPHAT